MQFNNEDEAWEYWQDWYEHNEGAGRSFDDQVDMFKEWLEEECVGWPDTVSYKGVF